MKGTTIKRLAFKLMIFAKKAIPYVLATASAAGTVAVTIEAVKEIKKNAPKVHYAKPDETIEDLEQKSQDGTIVCVANNDVDILKKKVISGIKTYWKPVVFCAGSLGCQFGSVFIFSKRQQQLVVATTQMQALLNKYAEAATATAGVGGAAALNKLAPPETPVDDIPFDPDDDGKTLFWDPRFDDGISKGYYFRATEADFQAAAKDSMYCFVANGIESIENFYLRMGVTPPMDRNGDSYSGWGWVSNEDFINDWCEYSYGIYIDYSEKYITDYGMEYRVVLYDKPPKFDREILLTDCKKYLNRWY